MSGGERRAEAAAEIELEAADEIELEASAMIGNPDRDSSPC
jgi:hypothetical protein